MFQLVTRRRRASCASSWTDTFGRSVCGEKWAFVGPHDDDQALGATFATLAAIAEGVEVHSVITTDGRMGYTTLGAKTHLVEVRRQETVDAYRLLGVASANIHRLEYPDLGGRSGPSSVDHMVPERLASSSISRTTSSRIVRATGSRLMPTPCGSRWMPFVPGGHKEISAVY